MYLSSTVTVLEEEEKEEEEEEEEEEEKKSLEPVIFALQSDAINSLSYVLQIRDFLDLIREVNLHQKILIN